MKCRGLSGACGARSRFARASENRKTPQRTPCRGARLRVSRSRPLSWPRRPSWPRLLRLVLLLQSLVILFLRLGGRPPSLYVLAPVPSFPVEPDSIDGRVVAPRHKRRQAQAGGRQGKKSRSDSHGDRSPQEKVLIAFRETGERSRVSARELLVKCTDSSDQDPAGLPCEAGVTGPRIEHESRIHGIRPITDKKRDGPTRPSSFPTLRSLVRCDFAGATDAVRSLSRSPAIAADPSDIHRYNA